MSDGSRDLEALRVLVVEDESDVRLGIEMLIRNLGADVRTAGSAEAGLAAFRPDWSPHLVVSDIQMPGLSGLDFLERVAGDHLGTKFIMITGYGTIEQAVAALRCGASTFLTKPFDNKELIAAVRQFGQEALLEEAIRAPRPPAERERPEPELVAHDAEMLPVLERIDQVAPTRVNVLIQGESGTGKELVARTIHARSSASDRAFLAVNTGALPDTLLESELFGHRRGAFTGADRDRKGMFEKADGGTVFLDEIGLMSPAFQAKLLRVLQERRVVPLGTSESRPVRFRLVAATGPGLEERTASGQFREDLYYRLRVVTIDLPPLRERPEDIPRLAAHFLRLHGPEMGVDNPTLSGEALMVLKTHRWPGNVRELENCIQRALVLSSGGEIRPHHLGLSANGAEDGELDYSNEKQRAIERFQRRFIQRALVRTSGNVSRAARDCGLSRAAFQRIMRNLELEREAFVDE